MKRHALIFGRFGTIHSLAVVLVTFFFCGACLGGSSDSRSEDPRSVSTWAVHLCSALETFDAAVGPLSAQVMLESVEETRAYALEASHRIAQGAANALEVLASLEPPEDAKSLHQSIENQFEAVHRQALLAEQELPTATTMEDVKALVISISVAAGQGEERIQEELDDISAAVSSAVEAIDCSLMRQVN